MKDGWVRIQSQKPDPAIGAPREIGVEGRGEDATRRGAFALIDVLPDSSLDTTNLIIISSEGGRDYWQGSARDWLAEGMPVKTAGPLDLKTATEG